MVCWKSADQLESPARYRSTSLAGDEAGLEAAAATAVAAPVTASAPLAQQIQNANAVVARLGLGTGFTPRAARRRRSRALHSTATVRRDLPPPSPRPSEPHGCSRS